MEIASTILNPNGQLSHTGLSYYAVKMSRDFEILAAGQSGIISIINYQQKTHVINMQQQFSNKTALCICKLQAFDNFYAIGLQEFGCFIIEVNYYTK